MTSLSKNNTALAEAIIDATDLSPHRKSRYKGQWRKWAKWCSEHDRDPYHATPDDMAAYLKDHPNPSKITGKRLSGAVNLVYKQAPGAGPVRLIGKPNHKPTSKLSDACLREYQIWSGRFTGWCLSRGKTAVPADQNDIAAFIRDFSAEYPPATLIPVVTHISRLHAEAGYHDITKLPAVATVLSELTVPIQEGEKPTSHRDKKPSTIAQLDLYRNHWRRWAIQNSVDADAPTTTNICDFIREETKYLVVKRIRPKLLAISEMLEPHQDPTKAPEVAELLTELVQQDAEKQRQGIRKQKRNKNPSLSAPLPTNPNLVEQLRSEGLTEEEIRRLTSYQHNRLNERTRKNYQRYWSHYKTWCKTRNQNPDDAGEGTLSLYLTQLARSIKPRALKNHLAAIRYCYKQLRPYDNPALSPLVFSSMDAISRENPSAPTSKTGLRHEHYEKIKETAHVPRPWERPHQTEIRAALDIALIGLMRDGLLRSCEVSKALWQHLERYEDENGRIAATLFIPISKNDQIGNGNHTWVSPETVEALNKMDQIKRKHGKPPTDDRIFQLKRDAIVDHIQRACEFAGIPGSFAGHSPRIGMAEDLAIADTSQIKLSHAGRWENPTMPVHYTRRIEAAKGSVAQWHKRDKKTGKVARSPLSSFGLISPYKGAPFGH